MEASGEGAGSRRPRAAPWDGRAREGAGSAPRKEGSAGRRWGPSGEGGACPEGRDALLGEGFNAEKCSEERTRGNVTGEETLQEGQAPGLAPRVGNKSSGQEARRASRQE